MTDTTLRRDGRALSTPLSHVLSVAITTILIIGLVASATGFLETQKERSASQELRTIGNRLAGELAKADTLARGSDGVSVTARHPETVAGSTYTAQLRHGSCSAVPTDTCLEISAIAHDFTTVIPVHNETELSLRSRGGGRFVITAAGGSGGTAQPTRRSIEMSPRIGIGQGVGTGPAVGVGSSLTQTPIPDFTIDPSVPETNDKITFDGSPSEDPDGSIATYEWDPDDDGTFENSSGNTQATWTYTDAGTKNVTLRVIDDDGRSAKTTRAIDVTGLEYNGDMFQPVSLNYAVVFTVTNQHSQSIEIERLLVDPTDTTMDTLDESDSRHELEINETSTSTLNGWVDWDNQLTIPDGGAIVDIDADGNSQSGDVVLDPGETARITAQDFPKPTAGKEFTFGVRYRIGNNTNSNVFTDTALNP